MKISIVIPALNEEETIGLVVRKSLAAIQKLEISGEVIISDNNSTDATSRIAETAGARVINVLNKGYGNALQSGFDAAKGEYILMADADDSYNLEEIKPFIDKLDEGYDFVIGNRYKGKRIKGTRPFLHYYLGTPVLSFILNLLFKPGVGDGNCGMRAFKRSSYITMGCHAPGFEFSSELIIKASINKLRITEIPCTLYPDKRNKPPHLKTWSDGWRHFYFMTTFFIKNIK